MSMSIRAVGVWVRACGGCVRVWRVRVCGSVRVSECVYVCGHACMGIHCSLGTIWGGQNFN